MNDREPYIHIDPVEIYHIAPHVLQEIIHIYTYIDMIYIHGEHMGSVAQK